MHFLPQETPIVELPAGATWFRVQRIKAISGSVRKRGFILPPAGILAARFDLPDGITAYLADSEPTALYETVFRREATSCTLLQLTERQLVVFTNAKALRLADLRGQEEKYPALHSLRYPVTQDLARRYRVSALDGILFTSAQHATHRCICIFESGIAKMRRGAQIPLVQPGTTRLHRHVLDAAYRSQVPIVDTGDI
ncbi:RES family NAD+ phosphorylase [Pigmentiphaga aceris]|uniref:RES family NAD+ phosphorylase n=1 Tax=Pigmentiphaga aceris TaxID=1940612 RepID=A0A5C0B6T6_9BURK|nr:RES family NAD+ phosphorylase [Pigmentiphaga aceris]QEI08681.1 RES family NAD+ phosphorylase [Pigmentiphaga aceris]